MLLCTYANKHTRLASVPDALLFRVVTLQVMVQCTVPVPDKNVRVLESGYCQGGPPGGGAGHGRQ
jgi:hypothetical protein